MRVNGASDEKRVRSPLTGHGPCDGDHLLCPGIANVSRDDRQLRKIKSDFVYIRDGPSGFRRTQRTGMADLGTKWDAKFDALGKQRVVASIRRRQVPKPGNDAKRLEAELLHGTA